MALITVTYLPAAIALAALQVIESSVLLARKGQVAPCNLKFAFVEFAFGLISLWEVIHPGTDGSRAVALAYLAYLGITILVGLHIRKSGWSFRPGEAMKPFPVQIIAVNLLLVTSFFAYALHRWQA